MQHPRFAHTLSVLALLAGHGLVALGLTGCGYPLRKELTPAAAVSPRSLPPIAGFEGVRAVDGYRDAAFQASFDETVEKLAAIQVKPGERRKFPMLVLSSGGVNGSFGAGILSAWSARGDRPDFWIVTGVSVGALMSPFVFAGPEFDERLCALFRRISPSDMHREKGLLSSVLWDESLMDNSPLRESIVKGCDRELLEAVAQKHEMGHRLYVGSTNLDTGSFVIWDMGAIAIRRSEAALELFREVLRASASIPVVYPPTLFQTVEGEELHADGAVVRPLFIPQNVFDGYASADRAGISWDDVDATLYVIHNGSLRPSPVTVQRDTIGIAMRTVTMMSYTMVTEHVLHLFMLARAWGADFRFHTMANGSELSVENFTPDDTEALFAMGQSRITDEIPWLEAPPGYVLREDLNRIAPSVQKAPAPETPLLLERMERMENALEALREELRLQRLGGAGSAPR